MNSNWTLMSYRELKKQIKKAVNELGTVLELKGVVANTSNLPLTGNKKGDVYIVSEDNTEYVWTSDNASGLITDYEELGPVISGSFLPSVTETDAGKVATVEDGEWTPMGELQSANNITIEANVEQDGSLSTVGTINYGSAIYLYNRGCLFVEIYRDGGIEQKVKCDFATDIADGLSWVFRGNYRDMLSGKPKTIAVYFTPPRNPDADPASITIMIIDEKKESDFTYLPATNAQPIPVLFNPSPSDEEFYFTVELTPEQIDRGYGLLYPSEDDYSVEVLTSFPPYKESTIAIGYLHTANENWYDGLKFALIADPAINADGPHFYSNIMELDDMGFTGMIGYLEIRPWAGYDVAMRAHLHYWSATVM